MSKSRIQLHFAGMLVVGMLIQTASGAGTQVLPFADSFESAGWTSSTVPWSFATDASNTGQTIRATAAVLTGAGTAGARIDSGTLTLDVVDNKYNQMWLQVYVKPVVGASDPTVAPTYAGAFYVADNGVNGLVKVYGQTGWQTTGVTVPKNQYLGFVVHIDYANEVWTLFYNTGSYKAPMTKATASNVQFPAGYAGANKADLVEIQTGDRAYVDAVAVSRGRASFASTPDRVLVKEFSPTMSGEFALPAYSYEYTVAPRMNLDQQLGDDLVSGLIEHISGLNPGDKVQIWHNDPAAASGEGYSIFTASPSGAGFQLFSGPLTPAQTEVYATTRLFFSPKSGRSLTYGFFPYENSTVIYTNGYRTNPGVALIETVYLNGFGTGAGQNTDGFTAIKMPRQRNVNGTGLTPSSLAALFGPYVQGAGGAGIPADKLYIQAPGSTSYVEYQWDPAAPGNWKIFGALPTGSRAICPAGANLWIKRRSTSGASVSVSL